MSEHPGSVVDPTADLRSDLAGAFGLPVWGSRLTVGSTFVINLGPPDPQDPRLGQWSLRVYCAAWRIETPGAVLVGCEDSREEAERGIAGLDGKVLVDAHVETPSMSATFSFADGTRLRTFSYSRGYEQWVLFRPDGMVRVVGEEYSWIFRYGGR